eukprot:1161659-Pelagomonas_calceolata.AAC.10
MRSAIPAVNAGAAGIKLLLVLLIHWAFQAICWHCRVVPLGHGTRCVQIKRWPQQEPTFEMGKEDQAAAKRAYLPPVWFARARNGRVI